MITVSGIGVLIVCDVITQILVFLHYLNDFVPWEVIVGKASVDTILKWYLLSIILELFVFYENCFPSSFVFSRLSKFAQIYSLFCWAKMKNFLQQRCRGNSETWFTIAAVINLVTL